MGNDADTDQYAPEDQAEYSDLDLSSLLRP